MVEITCGRRCFDFVVFVVQYLLFTVKFIILLANICPHIRSDNAL